MDRGADVAAAVVEIDVDPLRASLLQRRPQIPTLVVEPGVVAVVVAEVGTLLGTARDPYRTATRERCDLPHDLSHSPRSARHDDGVAGLRPAHVEKTEVGGETRRSEYVQGECRRLGLRRGPPRRPP